MMITTITPVVSQLYHHVRRAMECRTLVSLRHDH